MRTQKIKKVPNWAVCYLVNSDASALTDEDQKMVDDWVDNLLKDGLQLICPIDGTESEFEPYPAF